MNDKKAFKALSDVPHKTHQPGLFWLTQVNAADRKDPIYCVLGSKKYRSERAFKHFFYSQSEERLKTCK